MNIRGRYAGQLQLCRRVWGRIVLMNQRIVEIKIYTLSLLLSEAFLSLMAAFQYAVNRILLKYSEDVDLPENEKQTHTYKILREWPSARE